MTAARRFLIHNQIEVLRALHTALLVLVLTSSANDAGACKVMPATLVKGWQAMVSQKVDEAAVERSVVAYVAEKKKWPRSEYRIEVRGLTGDGSAVRVWVVHGEDERNPRPGGGKSIELYLSPNDYRIIRELAFQ
jgi:hypothetical protein